MNADGPPPPPLAVGNAAAPLSTHPMHRTLATIDNLANLLPTGTVLAFRMLIPSFSNKGSCQTSNRFLTGILIAFCSVICFLSTFTDSFTHADGKQYYGFATFKGLRVFNGLADGGETNNVMATEGAGREVARSSARGLAELRVGFMDFVHAIVSVFVFWVFALSDGDVQKCFFPQGGKNWDDLVMNLPLAAGVFSSFLFIVFPTTRRGIGHTDMPAAMSR